MRNPERIKLEFQLLANLRRVLSQAMRLIFQSKISSSCHSRYIILEVQTTVRKNLQTESSTEHNEESL